MTVTEALPGIFGEIRLADLHNHKELLDMVLPLIKRACVYSGGRHTIDSVVDGLIDGKYRLWTAAKPTAQLFAVAVSTLTPQANGETAFELLLLGGPEIDGLLQFMPDLKARARDAGASKISIFGRRSWERKLDNDWSMVAAIYEAAL